MKIAIVGLGKFGKTLAEHLTKENHDIIVIDNDHSAVSNVINEFDVNGYCGNGASYQTLVDAGVSNYDVLIATTSTDEVNILCCLVARKLGIKQTIARIRNPEYNAQIQLMSEDIGVSVPINPDLDTANEIYKIIKFPSALKVETFANGQVELVEVKVTKDSELHNLSLSSFRDKFQVNILICAVKRDNEVIIPKGEFILKDGDYVYISSSNKEIVKAFKKLKLTQSKLNSTMIIGCGKIAYYLTSMLIDSGVEVTLLDRNKEKCQEFAEIFPKVNVICGEASNQRLLLSERIENYDSIVTLTGIDETNIILSSYAKNLGISKVITKLSSSSYEKILTNVGLDSVVTPKEIFSSIILRYVRGMENIEDRSSEFKTLYRLINNRVEALEFVVSKKTNYTSIPLKDLKIKKNFLISCIIRNGEVIIPAGKDTIEVGDHIVIITSDCFVKDVSDILE